MMTTMAALMGTLPIALGCGAGAESRRPLGLAVVGGLLFSQMLTLYVTPVFYIFMDRLQQKLNRRRRRPGASPRRELESVPKPARRARPQRPLPSASKSSGLDTTAAGGHSLALALPRLAFSFSRLRFRSQGCPRRACPIRPSRRWPRRRTC